MFKVVGNGFNSHITHPVAVSAPGTVFTLFIQPQKGNTGEQGVKRTHGAKEAEEAFFKKRTYKEYRQNQYAQGGHDHGRWIGEINYQLRCVTNKQGGNHSSGTDLAEGSTQIV